MRKIVVILLLLSLFQPLIGFAHGDLDQRILQVTQEIKASPDSAYLYFKRGKLLFQHQEYIKSIDDLEQSNVLGYTSAEQKLLFSRNYFRLERYDSCLTFLDEVLTLENNNVIALKLQAHAYLKQNHFKKAAYTFEKVIEFAIQTFPENYIETSVAWAALGTDEGYDNAIRSIENGIKDLGHLISLYDRLIELAIAKKDYKYAIQTQFKVLDFMPRKEKAYFKLAELYELDGDLKNTSENITLAKQHFYELPLRIQNTSFMKTLISAIESKENNLQPNKP